MVNYKKIGLESQKVNSKKSNIKKFFNDLIMISDLDEIPNDLILKRKSMLVL